MRLVQMSDIHLGSGMHKPEMLEAVIEETNALSPDLVAIAGDLTETGRRWEFEEAKSYLDRLECPNVMTVMGNKDAKNVGRRHFKDLFGPRERAATLSVREGEAKVVAFTTRADFSFLRGVLVISGFVALGLIVASILFGFQLGVIFAVVMVGFASAAILYYTSQVLRYYRIDQHVAASVTLFASVALLFYYVLQILISLRRE